jgi:hypothetical protein
MTESENFIKSFHPDLVCWFQTYPENRDYELKDRIQFYGALRDVTFRLQELNKQKHSICIPINQISRKGLTAENTEKVNAVFIDNDSGNTNHKFQLEPSIRVQTKNGEHVYWLVKFLMLSKFRPWQKHLAKIFNSDPIICNLNRIMRVPGFWHNKAEPFLIKMTHYKPWLVYSEDELITAFGKPQDEVIFGCSGNNIICGRSFDGGKNLPSGKLEYNQIIYSRKAISASIEKIKTAPKGYRNKTIFEASARIGNFVPYNILTLSEAQERVMTAALIHTNGENPMSIQEIKQAVNNGINTGMRTPAKLPENR